MSRTACRMSARRVCASRMGLLPSIHQHTCIRDRERGKDEEKEEGNFVRNTEPLRPPPLPHEHLLVTSVKFSCWVTPHIPSFCVAGRFALSLCAAAPTTTARRDFWLTGLLRRGRSKICCRQRTPNPCGCVLRTKQDGRRTQQRRTRSGRGRERSRGVPSVQRFIASAKQRHSPPGDQSPVGRGRERVLPSTNKDWFWWRGASGAAYAGGTGLRRALLRFGEPVGDIRQQGERWGQSSVVHTDQRTRLALCIAFIWSSSLVQKQRALFPDRCAHVRKRGMYSVSIVRCTVHRTCFIVWMPHCL